MTVLITDTNLLYDIFHINPSVPDAHYSELWDKLAPLQNKLLEDKCRAGTLRYFFICSIIKNYFAQFLSN